MLCFIRPEVGKLKFSRYSQEKTMNWLKKKVLLISNLYEIQAYASVLFFFNGIQFKNIRKNVCPYSFLTC